MARRNDSNEIHITRVYDAPVKAVWNAWTDDAWYWAGESYMRSGDFARALGAFSKVFTYVSSDKHDDAQYQTGICYLRLGDRERATAELRKVEVLYPQSARVPLAKAELAKLQSH